MSELGIGPQARRGFCYFSMAVVINGLRFREDSITSTDCAPNIIHIHCKSLNLIMGLTVPAE